MKAIVQNGYGSPDVLALRDVDTPAINDDGILVKVHAASINALDWHITRGMPYVVRMAGGRNPTNLARGVDFAGRVVETGRNVTRFKPGDDVFGAADGSFAEFAATDEKRIALKPAGLSWEDAATLNVAGQTALQGVRDTGRLQAGQRALINGAGGGVGTFAVQIAKWLGARVTAMTRTENVEFMRSLGADEVIDYKSDDFTRGDARYDMIFDIGGTRPLSACRRVMSRNGNFVVVGGVPGKWIAPATRLLQAVVYSPFVSQRFVPFISHSEPDDLALLAELVQQKILSPVIARSCSLDEVPEAIADVGAGRVRGKIVVRVD